MLAGPGHGTVPGTCESQVNVNCVDAGLGFLEACCCNKLTFSCPLGGVIGNFSALAIAVEIIPGLSSSKYHVSETRLSASIQTRLNFNIVRQTYAWVATEVVFVLVFVRCSNCLMHQTKSSEGSCHFGYGHICPFQDQIFRELPRLDYGTSLTH